MAENESLDLGSQNARRWDEIAEDFRNGTPWEKIAPKVTKKLHEALRKMFKQLEKKGVSFEQLLNARGSPDALNELVKKTGNQPFAVLFQDVCASAGDGTMETQRVVNDFVWSVWDTISDQIEMRTVGDTDRKKRANFDREDGATRHVSGAHYGTARTPDGLSARSCVFCAEQLCGPRCGVKSDARQLRVASEFLDRTYRRLGHRQMARSSSGAVATG